MRPRAVPALAPIALLLFACGDPGPSIEVDASLPDAYIPQPAAVLFALPDAEGQIPEGFYALPYPNNLRLDSEGFVDLSGHPRPHEFLGDYMDAISGKQRGFSLTGATYVRFDGKLATTSLPQSPTESVSANASVFLVNLEPESPNYGEKVPMVFGFHPEENSVIGSNWLGVMPAPGIVLEEETTYGLVVTDQLLAEDGSPVSGSPAFESLRDSGQGEAAEVYAPLWDFIDEPGGLERSNVISGTVFTTQRATDLMGKFRQVVRSGPVPKPREMTWKRERDGFVLYQGRYTSPNFQAGEFPFQSIFNGGGFEFDEEGLPIQQGEFDLRFALAVPSGEMPEAGWPIALYAHGTGGDFRTFDNNGTSERLAELGIASISIDQVMHGDRLEDGDVETLFFNIQNPDAVRGNILQSALENFQLVRLVEEFDFTERHVGGRTIRFDANNIFFFGHSQGSQTGVPFVANEPLIKSAVFSGAGSLLYLTLLTKTQPFDIASVVAVILRDQPLDQFHPAFTLLQGHFEPADSITYGRRLVDEPPEGNLPKNVFVPIGFVDNFTPVPTIEALVVAMGADMAAPVTHLFEDLSLSGGRVVDVPASKNRGENSVFARQYDAPSNSDGHFVSFRVREARIQTAQFFKSFVDSGTSIVVDPDAD